MINSQEAKLARNLEKTDSFSFGSNSAKGSGVFKCYVDMDKSLEDIQKDMEKRLKVLAFLQSKGYCLGQEKWLI